MSYLKLLGGALAEDGGGGGNSSRPALRRHALALLALLATAPSRTLSRGKLVGFLWPEAREKAARNRLTSCVYEVRRALGQETLVTVGNDLQLHRDALACDVDQFVTALDGCDYRRAVELYGGPFLDGFWLAGSPEFEQRMDRERDRLQRGYHRAIEALAIEAEGHSEPDAAARWWRELAEDDPYDSRVAGRLIESLAAAGNRAEALRAAQAHTRLLERDFGAAPDAGFQAAVNRVKQLSHAAPEVNVIGAQQAEHTPVARERRGGEMLEDLDTYRLHVQGRGLLDQRTARQIHRSIDYFQSAIDREPGSALAWAGLADALSLLEFYNYTLPVSGPDPLQAAQRAVELAPGLGQTHASLGIINCIRQQGTSALRELELAVTLAPRYAEAYIWLGWVHLLRGSPEEALAAARRAVDLDPLAPAFRVYLAEILLANRKPREALREAERARDIQPEYGLAHFINGLVLYHLGRFAEAEHALEGALALVPRWGAPTHAEVSASLALIRAVCSDPAGARERLAQIEESAHPFSAGLVRAALGEIDQAFEAFAKVSDWKSFSTEHFRYFFPDVLGPLRGDSRYVEILQGIDRAWDQTPA